MYFYIDLCILTVNMTVFQTAVFLAKKQPQIFISILILTISVTCVKMCLKR